MVIRLLHTAIRLDEQLHPSSPSALLSWVSVTQATLLTKRGQGKPPSHWPLLCKIVPLLDKVASSKATHFTVTEYFLKHSYDYPLTLSSIFEQEKETKIDL